MYIDIDIYHVYVYMDTVYMDTVYMDIYIYGMVGNVKKNTFIAQLLVSKKSPGVFVEKRALAI